ncbi:uncharacterized protein METZ01_LOCUS128883, partial [marine metagenome]
PGCRSRCMPCSMPGSTSAKLGRVPPAPLVRPGWQPVCAPGCRIWIAACCRQRFLNSVRISLEPSATSTPPARSQANWTTHCSAWPNCTTRKAHATSRARPGWPQGWFTAEWGSRWPSSSSGFGQTTTTPFLTPT